MLINKTHTEHIIYHFFFSKIFVAQRILNFLSTWYFQNVPVKGALIPYFLKKKKKKKKKKRANLW